MTEEKLINRETYEWRDHDVQIDTWHGNFNVLHRRESYKVTLQVDGNQIDSRVAAVGEIKRIRKAFKKQAKRHIKVVGPVKGIEAGSFALYADQVAAEVNRAVEAKRPEPRTMKEAAAPPKQEVFPNDYHKMREFVGRQ